MIDGDVAVPQRRMDPAELFSIAQKISYLLSAMEQRLPDRLASILPLYALEMTEAILMIKPLCSVFCVICAF